MLLVFHARVCRNKFKSINQVNTKLRNQIQTIIRIILLVPFANISGKMKLAIAAILAGSAAAFAPSSLKAKVSLIT